MTRRAFDVAKLVAVGLCVLINPSLAPCAPTGAAGYSLVEDSKSPCGRYGIMVPDYETFEKGQRARLVTISNGDWIWEMKNADHFKSMNHGYIRASWQQKDNESLCLVVCNNKWNPGSVALLRVGPSPRTGNTNTLSVLEFDVWTPFVSESAKLLEGTKLVSLGTEVQFIGAGLIQLRAIATKDPKHPNQASDLVVVGIYDVKTHSIKMKPLTPVGAASRQGDN